METRVAQRQTLYVEHPEEPLPRRLVPGEERSSDAFADCCVASLKIGPNEPILVPEKGVQGCFGYTSSLNDAVNANGMYSFPVEELIGGV
jgi:hypothetical protein